MKSLLKNLALVFLGIALFCLLGIGPASSLGILTERPASWGTSTMSWFLASIACSLVAQNMKEK